MKGPCKRMEPIFKEMAKSNANINFLHVDIDEAADTLANVLVDISSVPTFYFYKDGKQIDQLVGGNPNSLREKLEKLKEAPSGASSEEKKAPEIKSKVIKIANGDEFKALISEGKVVVDFGAVWCMPCKVIEPIYDSLASEHENIKFLKIDVDKMKEHLEDVLKEINSVPTFYFYANGVLTDQLSGANPNLLKKKIEQLSTLDENEAKPIAQDNDSLEEKEGVTEDKQSSAEEAKTSEESNDMLADAKTEKIDE